MKTNKRTDAPRRPSDAPESRRYSRSPASDRTRRLFRIFLLVIAAVLYALSYVPGLPAAVRIILEVAAFLAAGFDIFRKAAAGILSGDYFSANVLMTVAGICALCINQPHESVLIMFIAQLGNLLQDKAVASSHTVIERHLKLSAESVRIQTPDGLKTVPAESIRPGETFMVFAGERIALDGVVRSGTSEIDTSNLTGDAQPLNAGPGCRVQAGWINITGAISVRATHSAADSAASRVAQLVGGAKGSKGSADSLAAKFSRNYTPVVFALALVIAVFVPLVFKQSYSIWIHRALVLLVVSCPCAFVASVPLCYLAGISGASRHGILFKNAAAVDQLSKTRCAAFGKTGILTGGRFSVSEVRPAPGVSKRHLLTFAVYAEAGCAHPLAQAILDYAGVRPESDLIASAEDVRGRGRLVTLASGQRIAAGNVVLMREQGIRHEIEQPAAAAVHIAAAGRYCGCILLEDTAREDARDAVEALYDQGIDKCIMLTGDSKEESAPVAASLNLSEVFSGCLPAEKLRVIETYQRSFRKHGGGTVAYIGDGVSDVPEITAADVGVALGAFDSEPAVSAADVVITTRDLKKVPEAVRLANSVSLICAENIVFPIVVKLILIIFGLSGMIMLWTAVLADVVTSVLAILNAMRCLKK